MSQQAYRFKLSQQAASYLKRLDANTKERINAGLIESYKDPIGASDHLVNRGAERKIRGAGTITCTNRRKGFPKIEAR